MGEEAVMCLERVMVLQEGRKHDVVVPVGSESGVRRKEGISIAWSWTREEVNEGRMSGLWSSRETLKSFD
jgi:hypothetical protein